MIALYIVLGLLLLILAILLIRVQVFVEYTETLTLVLKVLFVKITLISPDKEKKEKKPKKPKKPKKKKKPQPEKKPDQTEQKPKKPSMLAKLREKKGLTGILSLLTSVAKIAGTTLKNLFSHIVIHRFDFGILLAGEDASSVAVNYGRLCSVVYPAVNILTVATVCRDYRVSLEPVFDSDRKTEITVNIHAHLRPIFAVWEAIKAGVKLLIVRMKL